MENRSTMDGRQLSEAIIGAVLSDRNLIEGDGLHQALTEYIKENAEMIATDVISSQRARNAFQDNTPSQDRYPTVESSYYSSNTSPDGLPYYGLPPAAGPGLQTSPDGMSYQDLPYASGPSHYDSNAHPDGMPSYSTDSALPTDESALQPVHVSASQPPVWVKQARDIDIDALLGYASSLADSDYQQLAGSPYDNLWMSVYGIDLQVLDSFVSKIKFDYLVRHGALLIGDHLFAEHSYRTDQGPIRVEKVATIVAKGLAGPDIVITCTSPAGAQTLQIESCAGPASILRAFNGLQPPDQFGHSGCWQNLKVRRANLMLGTLYNVRQAFGYYQMLMDRYALASGTRYRQTRIKKKSVEV